MTLEVAYLAAGRMSTAKKVETEGEEQGAKDRNYYFPGVFLSS
jgi:hypothetical protein